MAVNITGVANSGVAPRSLQATSTGRLWVAIGDATANTIEFWYSDDAVPRDLSGRVLRPRGPRIIRVPNSMVFAVVFPKATHRRPVEVACSDRGEVAACVTLVIVVAI